MIDMSPIDSFRLRPLLVALLLAAAAIGAVRFARHTDPEMVATPGKASTAIANSTPVALPDNGPAPTFDTSLGWLNAGAAGASVSGKVVLVQFWTFGCVNCKNTLSHVSAWWDRYESDGLVIVGVHTPEFGYEADHDNIRDAVADLGVRWPVLLDDDRTNWRAFGNRYWPRFYLIDQQGHLRYDHIGEGAYDTTENAIRQLLGVAHDAPRAQA